MKMSRRILSLVLATALLIACAITGLVLPASAAGEELFPNGDFEQGAVAPWAKFDQSPNWEIAKGYGIDGSWGMKWVLESGNLNSSPSTVYANFEEKITISEPGTYRLSFNSTVTATTGITVALNSLSTSQKVTSKSTSDNLGAWATYHVDFVVSEGTPETIASTSGLYIQVKTSDVATYIGENLYFDNFSLKKITGDESLILDGDFDKSVDSAFFGTSTSTSANYSLLTKSKAKLVPKPNGAAGDRVLELVSGSAYMKGNYMKSGQQYLITFDYTGSAFTLRNDSGNKTNGFGTLQTATSGLKGGGASAAILNIDGTEENEWKSMAIICGASTPNASGYSVGFTAGSASTYIDNFKIYNYYDSELEITIDEEVTGGTITVVTDEIVAGEAVTVQATPDSGYVMVPGSLKYTSESNPEGVKILNKAAGGFGEGSGEEFAFEMPEENITVTAVFTQDAFEMDSIGASVHYTAGQADGIRFLTRLNVAGEFDATADALMLGGQEVAEIGTLLKRGEVQTLTLEDMATAPATGEGKMWKAVNYSAEAGIYKVDDYTGSYLDFATVMMTTVSDRKFTAVGYITFADGTTVYSNRVQVDSIASAEARM